MKVESRELSYWRFAEIVKSKEFSVVYAEVYNIIYAEVVS